jgi:hypothetical protein
MHPVSTRPRSTAAIDTTREVAAPLLCAASRAATELCPARNVRRVSLYSATPSYSTW